MAKVLEFDTFMQEAKGENLTVRVGGKDYSVPPKIPAIVPLMMARAEKLADQSSRNAAYSKMIFTAAEHRVRPHREQHPLAEARMHKAARSDSVRPLDKKYDRANTCSTKR